MVSRLCISQWQQAWRIYFLLLWFLLSRSYFAVLYNLCCLSALFLTAALWLLPKSAKFVLLRYKWTVHTNNKSLTPSTTPPWEKKKKTDVLFILSVWGLIFFVFSFFYLQFVYGLKKWSRIVVTTLLSFYIIYIYFFFFSYLVAIKDTLILNGRSVLVLCSRSIRSSVLPPRRLQNGCSSAGGWVRSGLSGRGTHWFRLIRFKDLLIRYEVAPTSLAICHRLDKPLISCSVWLAFGFW